MNLILSMYKTHRLCTFSVIILHNITCANIQNTTNTLYDINTQIKQYK